jgi:diphthine-ammonia ligase
VSSPEPSLRPRSPFSRLETETVIHSDSDFATVAFLRFRRVSLDLKAEQFPDAAVPALLDYSYRHVEKDIQARMVDDNDSLGRAQTPNYPDWASGTQLQAPTSRYMENWIAIGNVHREFRDASDIPLEDEIRECFHILQSKD